MNTEYKCNFCGKKIIVAKDGNYNRAEDKHYRKSCSGIVKGHYLVYGVPIRKK